MNQTHGENKSQTAKEKMEHWDKILDQYEREIAGLAEFKPQEVNPDFDNYLEMNRREIEAMSAEQCAALAVVLSRFAFHLLRTYNREIARAKWAATTLREVIADEVEQYKGSWSQQADQATKHNSYATSLKRIETYAQQRADRLYFLSTFVQEQVKQLNQLQMARAYERD